MNFTIEYTAQLAVQASDLDAARDAWESAGPEYGNRLTLVESTGDIHPADQTRERNPFANLPNVQRSVLTDALSDFGAALDEHESHENLSGHEHAELVTAVETLLTQLERTSNE